MPQAQFEGLAGLQEVADSAHFSADFLALEQDQPFFSGTSAQEIDAPPAPDGVDVLLLTDHLSGISLVSTELPEQRGEHLAVPDFAANLTWQLYEYVHVVPLTIAFGNILATQERDVLVWNTFRSTVQVLTAFVNNAGEGIEGEGPNPLPIAIQPVSSIIVIIRALSDGDAVIDGTIDLVFSPFGTVPITLTGSRIGTISSAPQVPIIETLEFEVEILELISGKERRISYRKAPRQRFTYDFRLGADERRYMESLLYGKQGGNFAVPLWFEADQLAAAAPAGTLVLQVASTAYSDYRIGDSVLVQEYGVGADLLKLEDMDATTLTLASATTFNFTENAAVMPTRTCILGGPVDQTRAKVDFQSFSLDFRVSDNDIDIASAAAWPTLATKVLLSDPNFVESGQAQESTIQRVYGLEMGPGRFLQRTSWAANKRTFTKTFWTTSRQELWEVRQLLHHLHGPQTSFFLPTFYADMVPSQDLVNSSTSLFVRAAGFAQFLGAKAPRNRIRVHLLDGTTYDRIVQSTAASSAVEEEIIVDTGWPVNVPKENVARIEFVELVRVAEKQVRLEHISDEGEAIIRVPVVTVFDEQS